MTEEKNKAETNTEEKNTEEKKEQKSNDKKMELKPGMTVKIYQKIKELNLKGEEKERVQFFEGIIVAKKHGKETGGSITVRKVSNGIGVEKIFPLNLPTIDRIEVKKIAKTKRAKLGFLKKGFKRKLKEKTVK